jgi:hypothetical protein
MDDYEDEDQFRLRENAFFLAENMSVKSRFSLSHYSEPTLR